MTIIKEYEFPNKKDFELEMPSGSLVLDVIVALVPVSIFTSVDPRMGLEEKVRMWAQVDEDNPLIKKRFVVLETGQAVPPDALYHVKSFISSNKPYHLFERSL